MRTYSQQKAGLTRAINSGNLNRVILECERVLDDWSGSYWPDDWSRWPRALDDAVWASGEPLTASQVARIDRMATEGMRY